MKNKFASRIAYLRRQNGWSQKDTAKKLGISQALLSHYEKGIRECGLDFLLKAADVFSCSIDYLLGASDTSSEIVLDDTDKVTADLKDFPFLLKGREDALNMYSLLYSITARIGNPEICKSFNDFVLSDVYSISRMLEKRYFDTRLFNTPMYSALTKAKSRSTKSFADLVEVLEKEKINVNLNKTRLKEDYPTCSQSLKSVIKQFEE